MRFKGNGWVVGAKYWKKTHKAFYCVVVHPDRKREERRLGDDANQAEGLRADIIAAARREGTPSPDSTVRDLCFQFLDQSKANNSHKTYLGYCTYLKSFCESLPPSLRVREMLKAHLENWLTKTYPAKGNPNTRRAAVVAVKRVFNWSVKQMGWFDRSPLDGYPTPAGVPRETLLAPEQWATVLAHYAPDDPFHDFLRVMICTGCRPQEVRIMAARHINWKRQTAFFERGEVPGKKSRARTVRLPSDVVAILRKWASKNPQGPVLRNEDGNPWSSTAVVSRFRRLQKKVPDFRPIAYLSRHSFTTLLCEAGDADVREVAQISGHADATMVLKVYGNHFDKRQEHLLKCVEQVDPFGEKAKLRGESLAAPAADGQVEKSAG